MLLSDIQNELGYRHGQIKSLAQGAGANGATLGAIMNEVERFAWLRAQEALAYERGHHIKHPDPSSPLFEVIYNGRLDQHTPYA